MLKWVSLVTSFFLRWVSVVYYWWTRIHYHCPKNLRTVEKASLSVVCGKKTIQTVTSSFLEQKLKYNKNYFGTEVKQKINSVPRPEHTLWRE